MNIRLRMHSKFILNLFHDFSASDSFVYSFPNKIYLNCPLLDLINLLILMRMFNYMDQLQKNFFFLEDLMAFKNIILGRTSLSLSISFPLWMCFSYTLI